jgi:replication initiation and membrane attachment protein
VGLIKSYTQFDTQRHYVYEMFAPLRPEKFFADDLFSVALYDTVGAERYMELSHAFTVTPVRRSDMHDISKKFTDVFHVSADVAEVPADVETVRMQMAPVAAPVTEIDVNRVDWQLLGRQLAGLGLADGELTAHQHAIAQVAGFYGLDTSSLARLLGRAIDVVTGKISEGLLRREAEQTYSREGVQRMRADSEATRIEQSAPATSADTPAKPTEKLTADEQALLNRAKTMPIREFMEQTKKAKNGKMFVADNERFAVQKLLDQNVFNAATLNVLVYYVLQNRPSISAAYLNSVANSWLNDKVETPEQAIAEIRNFRTGNTKQQQNHKRTNYSRNQRKEPVPDWAKPGYKAPQGPMSSAAKQAIAEKRARLQKTDKGEA